MNCQLNVYMAFLYCSTKQYRTAMKHCVTAITSVQSSYNMDCIERQLLPQFGDNIERVLGIILLYQFILNSSLNQVQQAECSNVYSVDSLAHYLAATCLKQEHNDSKCHLPSEFCVKYQKTFTRQRQHFHCRHSSILFLPSIQAEGQKTSVFAFRQLRCHTCREETVRSVQYKQITCINDSIICLLFEFIQTSHVTWLQLSAPLHYVTIRGDVCVQMWFTRTLCPFESRECQLFAAQKKLYLQFI